MKIVDAFVPMVRERIRYGDSIQLILKWHEILEHLQFISKEYMNSLCFMKCQVAKHLRSSYPISEIISNKMLFGAIMV